MGELVITSDGGDWQRTWDVMLFPSDPAARIKYASAREGFGVIYGGGIVSRDVLEEAWWLPSATEMQNMAWSQRCKGYVAGQFLHVACHLDRTENAPPSRVKIAFILSRIYRKEREQAGHGAEERWPIATSAESILSYWAEMMPAAHLWAAEALLEDYERPGDAWTFYFDKQRFHAFLEHAEWFRAVGAQIKPIRQAKGRKKPLLDPDETWKLPEAVLRRKPSPVLGLTDGGLPAAIKEAVGNYARYKRLGVSRRSYPASR